MSDREEYLEWELERYREAERQRVDEQIERDEQRQQEREERYEADMRTADSWPEALRKQRDLMSREITLDIKANKKFGLEPSPDPYFKDCADACSRALELWKEISPTKDAERAELREHIKALQEALEALEESVAIEVGQRLLKERGDTNHKPIDGWRMIADEMITGTDLNNFLYW